MGMPAAVLGKIYRYPLTSAGTNEYAPVEHDPLSGAAGAANAASR